MNIRINSVRFDADTKLEQFIEKKVNKLEQYADNIVTAEVYLRLGNSQDPENKIVEIRLFVPGNDLFVRKETKSFEESTDNAVDAMKQQLLKYKERIRNM
jgi:putative sigma-54 modulation protein